MYTAENLKLAVQKVKTGELSLREASRIFSIPRSTISLKKKSLFVGKCRRGPGTVLTEDEELSLVACIREAQNRGFPRTDGDI